VIVQAVLAALVFCSTSHEREAQAQLRQTGAGAIRKAAPIEGHDYWPGDVGASSEAADSGGALVVLAESHGYDRVAMCSYLVDTWCLGVKNAMGPKRVARRELEALRRQCYAPWRSSGMAVPLELAQHLVLGAVEFARRLGFEPHRDG
jgi:hypothetical protein